jgi:FkbM family methyltransferase
MTLLGRDLNRVFRAPFDATHYRTAIAIFTAFDEPLRALLSYSLSRGRYPWKAGLRTPTGPIAITLYGPHDVRTVVEIFCRSEYGVAGGEVVVDLGSNIGVSVIYFLTRRAGVRVYAYEPDPRNVAKLQANLAPFRSQVTVTEAAVAVEDGTALFRQETTGRYGGLASFSLRPQLAEIPVRCVCIASVLGGVLAAEQRIDVLKIDTEGNEADLVGAIPPAQRERIGELFYETNDPHDPTARLTRTTPLKARSPRSPRLKARSPRN